MAFIPMKLKPESGANRIKSADDAYSFMMYMRLSDRNKPHWQVAKQALNHASASDEDERLRELIISNASIFDIAADLGRTVLAVKARARALRIALGRSRFRVR